MPRVENIDNDNLQKHTQMNVKWFRSMQWENSHEMSIANNERTEMEVQYC